MKQKLKIADALNKNRTIQVLLAIGYNRTRTATEIAKETGVTYTHIFQIVHQLITERLIIKKEKTGVERYLIATKKGRKVINLFREIEDLVLPGASDLNT